MTPARQLTVAAMALALGACTVQSNKPPAERGAEAPAPGAGAAPPAGGDTTVDRATIERLERAARAVAREEGCAEPGQCRTAPVGAKACGGPRTYLVYCAQTTDSAALWRALDELRAAEQRHNRQHGVVSDCMLVEPPEVTLVGGACRAATRQ